MKKQIGKKIRSRREGDVVFSGQKWKVSGESAVSDDRQMTLYKTYEGFCA